MIVLVTGGTGSFGQAFTRIAISKGATVRIYSRNEYQQWLMRQEFPQSNIRWMIGDIRDQERLGACMQKCDCVVHAAALKHVSTGEYNPQEVINTNVLGSVNVVNIAVRCGVKKVLAISSDKAVEPRNLYGATKLAMETLFLEANRWAQPTTNFSVLRSGNFRESHGNVFEVWKRQTTKILTDPAMSRYYIPIDQVTALAWRLLEKMIGREIFIPKMEEVNMLDLLKREYPDCPYIISGNAPKEKVHEVLYTDEEQKYLRDCGDYYEVRYDSAL